MKKKIAIILLTMILLTSCMATLGACGDEEPRDVELELINPTTGEIMKGGDSIDLPEEGTLIRVRIKDKETGEYLTDDDLPGNTVKESWHANFYILKDDGSTYRQEYYEYWPTKDDIESVPYYNYYEMAIFFDCRPKNSQNTDFYRRYKLASLYVRFYINKPWRDGDDRYNQ